MRLPGRDGGDALQDALLGEVEGAAVAEAGDEQLNFLLRSQIVARKFDTPG